MRTDVEQRVREAMLKDYGVALGVFGIPDGASGTFSEREFYALAENKGLISPSELIELRRSHGDYWFHDLSD